MAGQVQAKSGRRDDRPNGYFNIATFAQPMPFTSGNAPRKPGAAHQPRQANLVIPHESSEHGRDSASISSRGIQHLEIQALSIASARRCLNAAVRKCAAKSNEKASLEGGPDRGIGWRINVAETMLTVAELPPPKIAAFHVLGRAEEPAR